MNTHVKTVAILHIASGALTLLAGIIVFLSLGIAGGIAATQGETEAVGILGIIGVGITGLLSLLALPDLIGGWALLAGRSWGRPLVIVVSIIGLLSFPLGTALGIYSLWALLGENGSSTNRYSS